MTALYSLYDALVGINVPTDKARAVVDAMERDMTEFLATKGDIALLRQDLDALRAATKSEFVLVRREIASVQAAMASGFALFREELNGAQAATKSEFALVRQEIGSLAKDNQRLAERMEQKFELQRACLIWLGSMQVVGIGLLYSLLKLGH